MRRGLKVIYSPARLSSRIAEMGRTISRDYRGRKLDVVIILESGFVFGADLVRRIDCPVVCHFLRSELRDIEHNGHPRREVFFSRHPDLKGRDVIVVDAILHTGVPQDFLLKRLLESRPRSLRVAVLLDKPQDRKVDLKPDYFVFVTASNHLAGYGLPGSQGLYRNLPCVGVLQRGGRGARSSRGKGRNKR